MSKASLSTSAFNKLGNVWKAKKILNKMTIRIYKKNVRAVLLFGADAWRTNNKRERKLCGVEGRLKENFKN